MVGSSQILLEPCLFATLVPSVHKVGEFELTQFILSISPIIRLVKRKMSFVSNSKGIPMHLNMCYLDTARKNYEGSMF